MSYWCHTQLRRNKLLGSPLNGIDFIEVLDDPALPVEERQRVLKVQFINPIPDTLPPLAPNNFRIEGGERVRDIAVKGVDIKSERVVEVSLDRSGDFSFYVLRLLADAGDPHCDEPPDGFDPVLSEIEFSFKAGCATDLDPAETGRVERPRDQEPDLNYLVKDYSGFRQLMLDRMAILAPDWTERNPADLGVSLVELLAYVADRLSYQQDAVGAEAYLSTARRRTSVSRHARLLDYFVHEGCNARVWVQIRVRADITISVPGRPPIPRGTAVLTRSPGLSTLLARNSSHFDQALSAGSVVFEVAHDVEALYVDHNVLRFYTWEQEECCLVAGATHATLRGHLPNLKVGDVLILQEALGPSTGIPEDADPARRWPVRLADVRCLDDDGAPLTDPLTGQQITEIQWDQADAPPFCFHVSSRTDLAHGDNLVEDVSVALGNIALADHGLSVEEEVRSPQHPGRRTGRLAVSGAPLTRTALLDPGHLPGEAGFPPIFGPSLPAAGIGASTPRLTVPAIYLVDDDDQVWGPRRDLLASGPLDRHFVLEADDNQAATLRFGDGVHGARLEGGCKFRARYRIGNGTAGNIGAEAIAHIALEHGGIESLTNPIAASGGTDPERVEEARHNAPFAFRTNQRAVTPDDYVRLAERFPDADHAEIQRAVATFRFTGSWTTVFITVDRKDGRDMDAEFEARLRAYLETYRLAGFDLEIEGPRFVPLELEMAVCVKPGYFRREVQSELTTLFSSGRLPDGRPGLFHPERLTFASDVYSSPLCAAAQSVAGVAAVQIIKFQRWGIESLETLREGVIRMGRTEIARLDNNPNYPDRGVFRLHVTGGK